jgi:hypothetical protein
MEIGHNRLYRDDVQSPQFANAPEGNHHHAGTTVRSTNAEQVLIFLLTREEGDAREIAHFFETALYGIQKQMDQLGRTRLYVFNPRYPFLA